LQAVLILLGKRIAPAVVLVEYAELHRLERGRHGNLPDFLRLDVRSRTSFQGCSRRRGFQECPFGKCPRKGLCEANRATPTHGEGTSARNQPQDELTTCRQFAKPEADCRRTAGSAFRAMIKSITGCLLLAITAFPVRGIWPELPPVAPGLVKAGLVEEKAPPAETSAEDPSTNVPLTQALKHANHAQNLPAPATSLHNWSARRPVVSLRAGSVYADGQPQGDWTIGQRAPCLAARSGMVGVTIAYGRAPDHPWPAGAQDVAAATSWIHQNIDLFG